MAETRSETIVTIGAKLYECRRLLRNLLGDERFQERVATVRPLIEGYSKRHDVGTIEAAIALCEPLVDGMPQLLVLATAVEMVEPSV